MCIRDRLTEGARGASQSIADLTVVLLLSNETSGQQALEVGVGCDRHFELTETCFRQVLRTDSCDLLATANLVSINDMEVPTDEICSIGDD